MPETEASRFKITTSNHNDIDFIFQLFNCAINYQRSKGYDIWPDFSRQLISKEIDKGMHWKIVERDTICCIFSVQYNDPIIWGERDNDPAVYLHRVAINPSYKGKGMMCLIKDWAICHAIQLKKKYVRMDTWGNNDILTNYYINCGFNYIGKKILIDVEGLPSHYGGSFLSLFENEV